MGDLWGIPVGVRKGSDIIPAYGSSYFGWIGMPSPRARGCLVGVSSGCGVTVGETRYRMFLMHPASAGTYRVLLSLCHLDSVNNDMYSVVPRDASPAT
jgi:hypothetical protein